MLCLLFFMCLCLIHACFLRSRPLPCSCLFSFCGFVLVDLWGHFVCFVVSVPFGGLFGCNHVGEYIFVMFGLLAACLSPLCLALQVRLFHVSLYKCLITAYPSLLCDKMLSFLYACYASCHLASITCWFALMWAFFFSFFLFFFPLLCSFFVISFACLLAFCFICCCMYTLGVRA